MIKSEHRGGQTIFKNFSIQWWDLELECGHTVERNVRYKPQKGRVRRGWSLIHHPRRPSDALGPPKRVRCDRCPKERTP